MIPEIRKKYNEQFTDEKYQEFLDEINSTFNHKVKFRICETPIFVPRALSKKIFEACDEIISILLRPDFKELTAKSLPDNVNVPNEDNHAVTLVIDLGICIDEKGELTPQLIELQGFPTIYAWENFLGAMYRKHFEVPEELDYFLNGFDSPKYLDFMKHTFLGKYNSENVILLEIEPEKQGTSIDFYITEAYTGIKPVCISKVIREGRKLFYLNDGVKTPIYRIYNRVIFDEFLKRGDLKCQFNMVEEVDVEWVSHPNWFYRVSKYTLPFIKSKYLPETRFLNEIKEIPTDLENYVLKPLFSFAGEGVIFNVTREDIDKITDRSNYILQRKVKYAQAIQSPEGGVKCEIRLLYLWPNADEKPTLTISLVRLSKGDLIGVKFNKDKTWVGGSIGFFES